jgi:hypothetical protein
MKHSTAILGNISNIGRTELKRDNEEMRTYLLSSQWKYMLIPIKYFQYTGCLRIPLNLSLRMFEGVDFDKKSTSGPGKFSKC